MALNLVLLAVAIACPSWAALPQFSWDTLPVAFHSANISGQYNEKTIAKFKMATFDKMMGSRVQSIDDEDEIVLAMKAIKALNPNIGSKYLMEPVCSI